VALTVVWEKASVDNPETGESNIILHRGEALPDFVDPFVRATMVQIGAVRDFGAGVAIVQEAAEAEMRSMQTVPAPVYSDEVPPVGRTYGPGGPPVTGVGALDPAEDAVAAPTSRPSAADNKETWERYAVARGYFEQGEAESMTKKDLMGKVNDRETAV
jgi:hypothetical protein